MREAQVSSEVLALHRRAIAGSGDLQRLRIADGHALDHVRDQRARRAPHHAGLALVVARLHADLVAVDGGFHLSVNGSFSSPSLPLAVTMPPGDGNLHAGGILDRIFSDA